MIKTATRTIPQKIAPIRPHDIPWMNSSICIRKRNKSHKLAKRSNTDDAWNKFKHFRNEVTAEILNSYVLSNLFSKPFSMYLYRCVLPCVNTYLEINTV